MSTMNFRLQDPCFTNFVPSTAGEAILKFRRLQTAGLASWRYPEAFVTCCKALGRGDRQIRGVAGLPPGGPGEERHARRGVLP